MHSSKNPLRPQRSPLLSIIVPLLNEAEALPRLFAMLQRQQGCAFELILVDGGSTDQTAESARALSVAVSYPVTILSAAAGRGRQMNAGAALASGEYFLFLHADSTFGSEEALRSGLERLVAVEKVVAGGAVAARFTLAFPPDQALPQRWRVFHTLKARQNRRGCIHGDQGFLLRRTFFARVGPFDETLPFLEDDRLSDRIFAGGSWVLLPSEITTSPRRFVVEGFFRRDCLNLVILALHQAGYDDWLSGLAAIYSAVPVENGRLLPVLGYIRGQLKALSVREEVRFWWAISGCLWNNLWQLRLLARAGLARPGGASLEG